MAICRRLSKDLNNCELPRFKALYQWLNGPQTKSEQLTHVKLVEDYCAASVPTQRHIEAQCWTWMLLYIFHIGFHSCLLYLF